MFKLSSKVKIVIIVTILLAAFSAGVGLYIHKSGLWPIIEDFIYTPKALLQIRRTSEFEFAPLRPINDKLTSQEMREDLYRLKEDIVKVHPITFDGLSKELEEAFNQSLLRVNQPLMVLEFHAVISEFLTTLGDAHTTTRLQTPRLPLEIKIIDNEFYVLPSSGYNVEKGDKLVSVGGVPIKEIYELRKSNLASENVYWYNYLFENNALSLATLFQLGVQIENGQVMVLMERDGELFELPMSFTENSPINTWGEENFHYKIDTEMSYVHFRLLSCEYSLSYKNFLQLLFQDIKDNNIENLILDLRGNVGGNVAVINEFLRYINIENYSTFNRVTVRLSRQASDQRGYLGRSGLYDIPISKSIKNDPVNDLLYDGKIYVLTDHGTFSAATSFATILADNGLATIVGQPTGGMPTCHGDSLFFQLPNSKLEYAISHKKFERVNEEKRFLDSLYPDYKVEYRIEDFFDNKDLEIEKVIELIQGK